MTPVFEKLQTTLDAIVAEQDLPGAVAAAASGSDAGVAAAGFADRELQIRMRPESILLSASIGKSFVAAMTLLLRNEGVFDLDAPISRWLADRAWFERLPNAHDITLRLLLNHGSGIPDHIYQPECLEWRAKRFRDPDTILSPEQMIAFILDKPALFAAGAGFAYSDTAYILVGTIVERATQRSYYDLLDERFLRPFGLVRTRPSTSRSIPGLASGYWLEGGAFGRPADAPPKVVIDGRMIYHPASEWTGGGLSTNPRDLASWAQVLYEGRAFRGDYLDEMLTPNPDVEAASKRVGGAYGLGVIIRESDYGRVYGHTGGMPGFSGFMSYYPARRFAIAMQVNQTSFDLQKAERELAGALLA